MNYGRHPLLSYYVDTSISGISHSGCKDFIRVVSKLRHWCKNLKKQNFLGRSDSPACLVQIISNLAVAYWDISCFLSPGLWCSHRVLRSGGTEENLFFARRQIFLLQAILPAPFLHYWPQTDSLTTKVEMHIRATGHGNRNVFLFHHLLKLEMETKRHFHFQLTTDQLSTVICLYQIDPQFMACVPYLHIFTAATEPIKSIQLDLALLYLKSHDIMTGNMPY